MAQIKPSYDEVRIPFASMTFSPDVPSTALQANEYNSGINVEADVRGVRSVSGDEEIFSAITGTPTFVTGGFRQSGEFWFIAATAADGATPGAWYASNGGAWTDITPVNLVTTGYTQATNISESWNGTVPVFNDGINPPFFLPDEAGTDLVLYTNNIPPQDIMDIVYVNPTTMQIQISGAYTSPPYVSGDRILITNVNNYFNGIFTVVSSTTTTIDYLAVPGASYPPGVVGTVSAAYTWNYDPNWKALTCGFVRMYSTPNVGNILVAGNLTATLLDDTVVKFPTTVRWSQAFGLNAMPLTWEPSVLNVANELEVPLRGEAIDAFPSNGQFFIQSYWDTVVFSPINYSTTSAPILGVRLFNQGRGLLTANCWANSDRAVYGIDARDIWIFDGQDFKGLGNQRVKHWFFEQLDPEYVDRVYMDVNTQNNQVEIYYTSKDADPLNGGVPNKMLSYRYDLDCWNAPRDVTTATFACESPVWTLTGATWTFNAGSRTIVYIEGQENGRLVQKDQGLTFVDGGVINSSFRRDNIKMLKDYSGKLMVHRILPEVVNLNNYDVAIDPNDPAEDALKGNVLVQIEGSNSVGQGTQSTVGVVVATDTDTPWAQINQNAYRVNSIEITSDPTTPSTIWLCSATTWQFTQVEDDR